MRTAGLPASVVVSPACMSPPLHHACPTFAMHAPFDKHAHHFATHAPMNRITDRCKNITFPQLRLGTVRIGNWHLNNLLQLLGLNCYLEIY